MNNSLSAIRGNLNTQLSEVTQLQQVLIGKQSEPSGFPFCRFFLTSISNELKDNMPSYWRTYTFSIEIWQEITNKTIADAEADLQDAIDAVFDKLGTEWTLDNNVDQSIVEGGTIQELEVNGGPMLIASITFSARTLIA